MREAAYFITGEQRFSLEDTQVVVGRQAPSQLVFPYPQISRQHLEVRKTEGGYTVSDLNSRFGSFLNGRPLAGPPVALQDGDELVLGGVLCLRFHDPAQTRDGKRVGRLKGVWIDPDNQDVWMDGQLISPPLSAAQLTLLNLLDQRTGCFVTREEIIRAVWPQAAPEGVSEEAVEGVIKRLRSRLREGGRDPLEVRRRQGVRLPRL